MRQPVVVLSNNDGCIISRSDEAKAIGVDMGIPYFQAKPLIEKKGVATFSSNYNLYGDLSWRVMETLRLHLPAGSVEVYSVDEAFIDLSHIPLPQLNEFTVFLKQTVERWTGIAVSIGVAPTKVLSKVANRLAKKHKQRTNCVLVLDTPEKIQKALANTPIEDIWGVGRQYAKKLQQWQISTALQLSQYPTDWAYRHMGGVTGARLLRELKGEISHEMEKERLNKKMIMTTRMFGRPVTELKDLREAVATYTTRAAEKLRRQLGAAGTISVFVVPREDMQGTHFKHGPSIGAHHNLPIATSATQDLIKPALTLVDQLYEKGRLYKKAGVMLSNIVPDSAVQGNLFNQNERPAQQRMLMSMIDNINFSMRDDILKFAAAGTTRNWKMRQELRSPRYTTRWHELPTAT